MSIVLQLALTTYFTDRYGDPFEMADKELARLKRQVKR